MSKIVPVSLAREYELLLRDYESDILKVEDVIDAVILKSNGLAKKAGKHLLGSGGKRIRPLILMISSRLCGYSGSSHIVLGAVLELIHSATLLHDDVVDFADIRRGDRAARCIWGNQASILVGDFLFANAMRMLASLHLDAVNELVTQTCCRLAEGEILQLTHNGDASIDDELYFQIISLKTAELIGAACKMGGILSGVSKERLDALWKFGVSVGMAFQLADDMLDYSSEPETLGKSIGKDLVEGKITLPLLHLLRVCLPEEKAKVENIIYNTAVEPANLCYIQSLMKQYHSFFYARDRAYEYVETAKKHLRVFDDSKERETLFKMADFFISRDC